MKLTKESDLIICPGCGEHFTRKETAANMKKYKDQGHLFFCCPLCEYEVNAPPYRPPSLLDIVEGRLEKFDNDGEWQDVLLGAYLTKIFSELSRYSVEKNSVCTNQGLCREVSLTSL